MREAVDAPRRGLAWLEALGPQKIRPGLARTRALLLGLGSPERSFRSVLIAGTNGKGSTAATCAAVLHAAGLRTGLYTSPHLLAVNERIRTLERDVDDRRLDEALALVAAVAAPEGHRAPSYFEALTVAAFELFRRARVEVAVVEVGIGGLLDATNVLSPALAAVTNVGADHLEVLGPTLEDVARQKAGIFRRGVPALVSEGPSAALLAPEAERAGTPLEVVPESDAWEGVSPLRGRHQRANVALGVALARRLAPLEEETVRRGVAATRWPGRLQNVALPGGRLLVVDGAHNEEGARALAAWIDAEGLSGKADLLFGALLDKDLAGMLARLAPRARRIVLTAPASPRAADPARLAELLGGGVPTAPDAAAALARLLSAGDPVPIIAAGSLVLVGDVLAEAQRLWRASHP